MTLKGLFVRFAIIYFVFLLVGSAIIQGLGLKSGTGVNIAALLGATTWVCSSFGKTNGYYFNAQEKLQVVFGFLGIDLLLQAIFTLAILSLSNTPVSIGLTVAILSFVGVLHGLVIYFFVGSIGKQLEKTGYQ